MIPHQNPLGFTEIVVHALTGFAPPNDLPLSFCSQTKIIYNYLHTVLSEPSSRFALPESQRQKRKHYGDKGHDGSESVGLLETQTATTLSFTPSPSKDSYVLSSNSILT